MNFLLACYLYAYFIISELLTCCAIKNDLFDAIYGFLGLIVFFAIIAALCGSLRYRFKPCINSGSAIADESFSEILGFRSVGGEKL